MCLTVYVHRQAFGKSIEERAQESTRVRKYPTYFSPEFAFRSGREYRLLLTIDTALLFRQKSSLDLCEAFPIKYEYLGWRGMVEILNSSITDS